MKTDTEFWLATEMCFVITELSEVAPQINKTMKNLKKNPKDKTTPPALSFL